MHIFKWVTKLKIYKKLISLITIIFVFGFIVLIIVNPALCRDGAINGILVCGRIIIPSLYPFTVCVLFLMKSGIVNRLDFITPVTVKILGINAREFIIMLFSFIGGFPVGAKLINECVASGKTDKTRGGVMLNYCINAGPAFIIGAVGIGITGSREVGYILLLSHILSALILCLLCRFFLPPQKENAKFRKSNIALTDAFVLSAAEAASAVLNVCAFIILFSAINTYLTEFSEHIPILKWILLLTEVTNGITNTNNILLISFLLGFSGICVWCQIISAAKAVKINYFLFVLFRVLHGAISAVLTFVLLKIFSISIETFSNNRSYSLKTLYSTPALSISMLIMCIVFMISVATKKYSSKILEDVV